MTSVDELKRILTNHDNDNFEEDCPESDYFFMGNNWITDDTATSGLVPGYRYIGKHLCVNCSDTFAYACADAEHVPDDEYPKLCIGIEKFGYDAVKAYVSKKRDGDMPLRPMSQDAVDFFADGFK